MTDTSTDGLLATLRDFDALLLTALIWFLAKFLRYAFPALFGTLQSVYHVSNTVLGTAFTGLMLVYAAMQFPSGALADRLGAVRVVTAGAVLAAAGALSLVVPAPFAVLVAGMLLVGLGTGAHKTVAVRLLSRVYPTRTGRALGIMDTFGAFGGVVAPAVVAALTGSALVLGAALPQSFDWRLLFLGGGVVGLLLAALFVRRVPRHLDGDVDAGRVANDESNAAADGDVDTDTADSDAPAECDESALANASGSRETDGGRSGGGRTGDAALGGYAALFSDRRFLLFVGVTVLFSFAYNGAVAFLPLFLSEGTGLDAGTANLLYSVLFLVSVVQMATGELSDRVGPLWVVAATLTLAAAGLGLLLVGSGPLGLGVAVVVLGLGSHGFRPVRGAYLVDVIPDDVAGGALGIVRTAIMGAGAVAPAIVGFLSDRAGYHPAFDLLFASLVGSVALVAVLVARSR